MSSRTGAAIAVVLVLLVGVASGCGTSSVDSGGLSADDRNAAQGALEALHGSNVALQLVAITKTLEATPAACRVHALAKEPRAFKVYVFWIPWLSSDPYTWLDMTVTKDPARDVFRLETAKPVLPGGRLSPDGRAVDPFSRDSTLLSRYGPAQDRRNQIALKDHAGDAFEKPGGDCQVLMNGDLRLVENP